MKTIAHMIFLVSSVLLVIIANGCKNTKNKASDNLNVLTDSSLTSEGAATLLANNCYVCHNPNSISHDDIIAPPLAGIKKRYQKVSEDRSDFIATMSNFVFNPIEESALMKGPIKRFGLMPKTALTKEEITAIVSYVYDNQIPEPSWFSEHEKGHK